MTKIAQAGVAPGQHHLIEDKIRDFDCLWVQDESGTWWTDCENGWELIESTPTENNMSYCPFCGKNLVEEVNPDHES